VNWAALNFVLADLAEASERVRLYCFFQDGSPFRNCWSAEKLPCISLYAQIRDPGQQGRKLSCLSTCHTRSGYLDLSRTESGKRFRLDLRKYGQGTDRRGDTGFPAAQENSAFISTILSLATISKRLNRRTNRFNGQQGTGGGGKFFGTAEAFKASGGREELLRVIPNGFEISRFHQPLEDRSPALPLGMPEGRFSRSSVYLDE